MLRLDSHSDRPSSRQNPDSAPGTEMATERSGVSCACAGEGVSVMLACLYGALRAEEVGLDI